jgi:hypothetical protein
MKTSIIYSIILLFLLTGRSIKAQDLVMVTHRTKPTETAPTETENKKTFQFYAFSQTEKLKNYDQQSIEEHFLGDNVARRMCLFNETYTVKTPISPGSPTMKMSIRKPLIYTSVRKIEKQLKKDVKNNLISIESAADLYSKVLDIAISVVNDDTTDFEKEIKSSDVMGTLLELFTQRVTLKYI